MSEDSMIHESALPSLQFRAFASHPMVRWERLHQRIPTQIARLHNVRMHDGGEESLRQAGINYLHAPALTPPRFGRGGRVEVL